MLASHIQCIFLMYYLGNLSMDVSSETLGITEKISKYHLLFCFIFEFLIFIYSS